MSGRSASARDRSRRSWLPRGRATPLPADAAPWVPVGFADKPVTWTALSYLVIDELSKQVARFVVSSWPVLDAKGRVRSSGSSWEVGAAVAELVAMLNQHRIVPPAGQGPAAPSRRPLRIGDAFAASATRPRGQHAAVPPLARWLSPPIYDVSAAARDAAKAALFGALAPTMSEDDVYEIATEALDLDR